MDASFNRNLTIRVRIFFFNIYNDKIKKMEINNKERREEYGVAQ